MCGIAGQYSYHGGTPDTRLLSRMAARIAHRGPDGEGTYIKGSIALAHRRLAIIDLSPDGSQPMTNEDGSLRLVFNGEIYNFVGLREELVKKGHRFHSKSDSEVILHAYEAWGTGCLTHLNGMWAFALWDETRQELFCARDRFGIKPFYYTEVGDTFLFASEIKALLAHPDAGKTPDDEILGAYLAWGVQDHTDRTMFTGIRQLKPAHALVVKSGGCEPPFRYWEVSVNNGIGADTGSDLAASHLRTLLTDATRSHLQSDVPVGTCLSGGIDSSTLTVIINTLIRDEAVESVGARQKTFSAVFSDKRFDESRYIDEVVSVTGVDAARTEPTPDQLSRDIDRLVYMQDEPFGSLSIYAQYCVMQLAATKVKVVLDGQGADELLGGYIAYQGSYTRGLFRTFHWGTAFREVIGSTRHHRGFFKDAVRQLHARKKRRHLLRGAHPVIDRYGGSLDEVLHDELTATNLPALLHYEDRNSMAFSLESRVPYLDLPVVEYIAALPLSQKIQNGVTKIVLRRATKGLIPESIRCRMDKMGFVTPEQVWMREALRPFMLEILSSARFKARPYWDADAAAQDYLAFLDGKSDYSPDLWRIACTELWLRKFFDHRHLLDQV
ncbi:MAG: asparagine synthase (glutamine-hydrolyzing) [Methanoregula sp.]